ncbi:hypothetical protein IPM19_03635 [bacterium]|nr:MAG: hypothetical protein IPM19_03635 [bacterium]
MESLTLTDLFFWLTGLAVILITALLTVALVYLISFLRTIRLVARQAQRATQLVSEDLVELKKNIKDQGFSIKSLIKFLFGLKTKQNKRK